MSVSSHTKSAAKFRKLLQAKRVDVSLTQVELSKRLGRPQSYVSKYETGERRLDVIEFLDVMRALRVDPVEVLTKLTRSIPDR